MRLDRVTIRNYKCFADSTFEFDPSFNLIVSENGGGKTSLSEAIAHMTEPWISPWGGGHARSISQIRVVSQSVGSGIVFQEQLPLEIAAEGIVNTQRKWKLHSSNPERWIAGGFYGGEDLGSVPIFGEASEMRKISQQSEQVLPVIAFYRAGRAFQTQAATDWNVIMTSKPQRSDGYKSCLSPATAAKDFSDWLGKQEAIMLQDGSEPAIYRTVKQAIVGCLPGASKIWFNVRYGEPMVQWQDDTVVKFSNLSDGQRGIVTLIGDIARRTALLNPQFDAEAPAKTPGMVLIDELDLHLHPRWQRRIVADLKHTFPLVQFFCTTHSPQIIGEVPRNQVIVLTPDESHHPSVARGADSNWILEHVMDGAARSLEAQESISKIEALLEDGDLEAAKTQLENLKEFMGATDGEVTRLESTAYHLEALAHADD